MKSNPGMIPGLIKNKAGMATRLHGSVRTSSASAAQWNSAPDTKDQWQLQERPAHEEWDSLAMKAANSARARWGLSTSMRRPATKRVCHTKLLNELLPAAAAATW